MLAIRDARLADVDAITSIYNDAVLTTTAAFDVEPRTVDDRRAWLTARGPRHPVLVAEHGGRVVGWASLSPWLGRTAYAYTAEVSIYVEAASRGRQVGRLLLAGLVERARALGLHALLALVTEGNEASLRLHRSAGFVDVGVMREVGYKFGAWLDVRMLERLLPTGEPSR